MLKQYSAEILALRDRIIKGNDKLNVAFEQIKALDHDSEEWSRQMELWHQANKKLSGLCTELKLRGYENCLYLNEKGEKTRKCLEGLGCRVCPSAREYWTEELMSLPGPKGVRTGGGEEQREFLETLGGKR